MDVENRTLVLQCLNVNPIDDAQIIEMLLFLLDDWEVRASVVLCRHLRSVPGGEQQEADERPYEVG